MLVLLACLSLLASSASGNRSSNHHHRHHSLNLHAVWDDALIEKCVRDEYDDTRSSFQASLLEQIESQRGSETWDNWVACPDGSSKECVSSWAEESLDDALMYAYAHEDGSPIVSGDTLSLTYYETRIPIVRERLALGGLRLATTLELAFAGKNVDLVALE